MTTKRILLLCFCLVIGYLTYRLTVPIAEPSAAQAAKPPLSATPTEPVPITAENELPGVTSVDAAIVSQETTPEAGIEATIPTTLSATNEINLAEERRGAEEKEKYRLLHQLRDWAAHDAESALAAVLKLPEGRERNQALGEVCFGLAQNQPADAVELAKSLHLDDQPGAIMEYLVQQWATVDPEKSVEWVNAQPAGVARDGLMTRIASVLAQSSPTEAANLALNQMTAGQSQNDALLIVVHQLGSQNLDAATAWVNRFPNGVLRDQAIAELQLLQSHQQAKAGR